MIAKWGTGAPRGKDRVCNPRRSERCGGKTRAGWRGAGVGKKMRDTDQHRTRAEAQVTLVVCAAKPRVRRSKQKK